jgi:hypothetical protein
MVHPRLFLLFGALIVAMIATLTARLSAQSLPPERNRSGSANSRFRLPDSQKPKPVVNAHPPFLAYVKVNREDRVFEEGDHLQIEFLAQRQAFLYLFYHQADGRTLLLFPNSAAQNNDIPGRQVVRIPGPGLPFGIRIRPPLGKESVQVVAARQRVAELDALLERPKTQPVIPPQLLDQLAERLSRNHGLWAEYRLPIETVPAGTRPEPKPARMGLFFGIGKYQNEKIAPTHEELRHSAEVMYDNMLKLGKLDPQRTQLVVDDKATRANMEKLITHWLPEVSQPGDTVFIYFSGHAGQVNPDPNGENSSPISVLGPYDVDNGDANTRAERDARMLETSIPSDMLSRWLEELSGRQVVLVLDTCHSGTMLQPKTMSRFFSDHVGQLKDITQMNAVVLTSCAGDEEAAFEDNPQKTMWFTYFLADSMEKLKAPVTIASSYQYTLEGMKKLYIAKKETLRQEPQLSDTALLPIYLAP